MSVEDSIRTVKEFFAAMGSGDRQRLLALSAEDIEWIIPGEDWPLAGTYCGHDGLEDLLQKASEAMETSFTKPSEFAAQGDRVMVIGVATVKVLATNNPWEEVRGICSNPFKSSDTTLFRYVQLLPKIVYKDGDAPATSPGTRLRLTLGQG